MGLISSIYKNELKWNINSKCVRSSKAAARNGCDLLYAPSPAARLWELTPHLVHWTDPIYRQHHVRDALRNRLCPEQRM